jgi:hypothetical protein
MSLKTHNTKEVVLVFSFIYLIFSIFIFAFTKFAGRIAGEFLLVVLFFPLFLILIICFIVFLIKSLFAKEELYYFPRFRSIFKIAFIVTVFLLIVQLYNPILLTVAKRSSSAGLCNSIMDSDILRVNSLLPGPLFSDYSDWCISKIGIERGNVLDCEKISINSNREATSKARCIQGIAKKINKSSLCENINSIKPPNGDIDTIQGMYENCLIATKSSHTP